VLHVQGLVKRYGDVLAVADLTVDVARGESLILLGRNGAGKSTAMRCMAGLALPTAGRVVVDGVDVRKDANQVRARIGLMPEVPGLYERMSARAYLDYFGSIYEIPQEVRRPRIEEMLAQFDLLHAGDRWLGTFSKGMRQKVALIRATLHRPKLILADEPTSALDPDSARRAWAFLNDLRAGGCSLVICTHSMEEAEALSGSIGIMSAGRLLAHGTMDELVRQSGLEPRHEFRRWPGLQDIYLAVVGEHLVNDEPITA
jgi:ABC-2 type transport system ATP-binding protein